MEKMMKQKKIWIAAVGVVLLAVLIVAVAALGGGKEPAYRSIKIVELAGEVSIDRGGVGTLAASENMNLVSGDRVTTAEEAYVVLCLDTDKYVMLGEAGAMTVVAEGDGNSGKTSISLEGGSVLNEIRNPLSEGSSYEIATPNATMSVRGTVFEVRKENEGDGQISVLVYDGSVAVGLDGQEPVLYSAGEYTVFTGDAEPEVLVERGTVSDDVLDNKVRERLQQISTEGRTVNAGSADLSAAVPANSVPMTTPDAAAAPMVTATPAPTAAPMVTATPAPTAAPMVTATPAPTAEPVVEETPVPEIEEEDEEDSEEDFEEPEPTEEPAPEPTAAPTVKPTSEPTAAPTIEPTAVPTVKPTPEPTAVPTIEPTPEPTRTPRPTWGPWWPTAAPTVEPTAAPTAEPTAAPTAEPTAAPVPPQEGYCMITYMVPYVLVSGKEPENSSEAEGITSPLFFAEGKVKKGELAWKQDAAKPDCIPNRGEVQELEFVFVGWYKINGFEWNFDTDVIMEDTILYPVWKDKDGNLYKVKISEEFGVCYNIKEPSAEPGPAPSSEPISSPSPAPSGEPAGES